VLAAFVQALQKFGWSDGRNGRFEIAGGAGNAERYQNKAAELVAFHRMSSERSANNRKRNARPLKTALLLITRSFHMVRASRFVAGQTRWLYHPIVSFLHSRWFWIVIILVASSSMIFSIKDLCDYAGIDLRSRVVGARAILLSLDPYSTGWHVGMPLELADSLQRYPGVSRNTADPPFLLVYVPFANFSYRTQQIIWWGLGWFSLAATIFALLSSDRNQDTRRLFFLVAVICVVGSWFWRLHAERGQYYIFVTMLVCFDIAALRNVRESPSWLGIPSGIAIALRPTNVILAPLLWLIGERRAAISSLITAALISTASLCIVGWSVWKHYFENVNLTAYVEVVPNFQAKYFGPIQAVAPPIIEGLDFSKALPARSGQYLWTLVASLTCFLGVESNSLTELSPCVNSQADSSNTIREATKSNLRALLFEAPRAITLSRAAAIFLLAFASITTAWMARQKHINRDVILLFLSTMLVLIDFTRPERNTYADVAFLPVIAILLSVIPNKIVFKIFLVVTLLFFVGPIESTLVGHLRHLFMVTLVLAVVIFWAIQKPQYNTSLRRR